MLKGVTVRKAAYKKFFLVVGPLRGFFLSVKKMTNLMDHLALGGRGR